MTPFTELDNPVWMSLTTLHRSLGRVHKGACRYDPTVSPFAGLQRPTTSAFAALVSLVAPGEIVAMCTAEPISVPDAWQVIRTRVIEQMVCPKLERSPISLPPSSLEEQDVPDMLALTAATEPGPFLPQTIRMGRYFGIRSPDGSLLAMAGERLRLESFTEISGVCTAPEARGRGHAGALVTFLAGQILAEGRIPFLHVKQENEAKLLYERIGFRVRSAMNLTVISHR